MQLDQGSSPNSRDPTTQIETIGITSERCTENECSAGERERRKIRETVESVGKTIFIFTTGFVEVAQPI